MIFKTYAVRITSKDWGIVGRHELYLWRHRSNRTGRMVNERKWTMIDEADLMKNICIFLQKWIIACSERYLLNGCIYCNQMQARASFHIKNWRVQYPASTCMPAVLQADLSELFLGWRQTLGMCLRVSAGDSVTLGYRWKGRKQNGCRKKGGGRKADGNLAARKKGCRRFGCQEN